MSTSSPSRPRELVSLVLLLTVTVVALGAGVAAWLFGWHSTAQACWAAGTVVALGPAVWWVGAAVVRGRLGVDLIAVLSLAGALVVREYLAGALIAVMLATGRALEAAAVRRAAKDLRCLIDRAPRSARRVTGTGIITVPLSVVTVGDRLIVGPGEVVPVDGRVAGGPVTLDESALTGESIVVDHSAGTVVRSGAVNAGMAFEIESTTTESDSTYAGIVRLAREAAAESAPVVRLADRLAVWFVPLTLAVASAAWVFSGSLVRAVAVLVVATPCPLLLAAPVAIVSGLSRASRRGVVIRGGAPLEILGRATTLILDKTGTVTTGRPHGTEITVAPDWTREQVLALAASAEQFSPHILAKAILDEAAVRGLPLRRPTDVTEDAGRGVTATVDGHRLTVGNYPLPPDAPQWATEVADRAAVEGSVVVWIGIGEQMVGAICLHDPLRADAPRTLRRLRAAGINRVVLLTGDRPAPAAEIGAVLGVDEVCAGRTPAGKVAKVREESQHAVTVMVGDGVNDAPALAAAAVGIALRAGGTTASSEAADIVLVTDRLDRLADAIMIARRSRRIAVQSATVGMALSLIAMVAAALGALPPAVGALLQEGIDVAVILNALRALRVPGIGKRELGAGTERLLRRFSAEHTTIRAELPLLRDTARQLASGCTDSALPLLRRTDTFLERSLLPHEHAEEGMLYPALAIPLGGDEATASMSRMHAEIDRLARRVHAHLERAEARGGISTSQTEDLLACLYGLHTLLMLHFAAEEENYFTLLDDDSRRNPQEDRKVPTAAQRSAPRQAERKA